MPRQSSPLLTMGSEFRTCENNGHHAFCAASSETAAVIGRFVATVLGRVSLPGKAEEWYVVSISLLRVPGP